MTLCYMAKFLLEKEPYILVKTEYDKKRGFVFETFKTKCENFFWIKVSKK